MTSRERVMTAFDHREPDRVPAWCGASPEFWDKAKKELGLDDEDRELIERVLAPGPAGPVYGLERDRSGRHGRIMKYNLNTRPDDQVLGVADG